MHHLIYITAEVLAAAALFAVPPLRRTCAENPIISVTYPIISLVFYTAAACFFLFICQRDPRPHFEQRHIAKHRSGLAGALFSAAGFALLLLCSLLWQHIAAVFSTMPAPDTIPAPNTPAHWMNFIAGTAAYACCEEFMYRIYFPRRLHTMQDLSGCRLKTAAIAAEIIPAMLFALAHRYLGFFAVANAVFAAGILRMLYLKTASIPCICIVHAAYNFVQFFMLFQKN